MIRMQGLTADFNAQHPDIKVEWGRRKKMCCART
jgi:hypothetical protein